MNPRLRIGVFILAVMPWIGCLGNAPQRRPTPPPPVQAEKKTPESHVIGDWENPGRSGKTKKLIFEPGGLLRFEGGMEYFNPGQWNLNPLSHELTLTLPQAGDDNLQI